MELWNDHGIIFLIGLLCWPRLMLIYYGLIPIQSISAILEFSFIPRIFLVSILSPFYYSANPTLISVYWILAIILDIVGIIFKFKMQTIWWTQCKTMRDQMFAGMQMGGYHRPF